MKNILWGTLAGSSLEWNSRETANIGIWKADGHTLTYRMTPAYPVSRGFLWTVDGFENLHTLSFRFLPIGAFREVAVWLRSFRYTSVISLRQGRIAYRRLDSLRYTGMEEIFSQPIALDAQWNILQITAAGSNVWVCLNGQQVLEVSDADRPVAPLRICLKTDADGVQFRDFCVQAEPAAAAPEAEELFGVQFHADFMNEPEKAAYFSGWQLYPGGLGTKATAALRQTWLHCFAQNGEVSARVLCDQPGKAAVCGIFARFAVEGSFLRAGFDFGRNAWFIAACAGIHFQAQQVYSQGVEPMCSGVYYDLRLCLQGGHAELFVNEEPVVFLEGTDNGMYGRMGLFAQNTAFCASAFSCPGSPIKGVTACTVGKGGHMALQRIGEETLVGASAQGGIYITRDNALHFTPAPAEYAGLNSGNDYPNLFRRKTGEYIQLLSDAGFLVRSSRDLKSWKDLGCVLTTERLRDEKGRQTAIVHISSFTEVPTAGGKMRLFLPVAFRQFRGDGVVGHYTCVFYSDDGGITWEESQNDVRQLQALQPWRKNMSWCEAKILLCDDGRLRMYCSRTLAPSFYYADSFDGGVTWTAFGTIPQLSCATVSFAVCEDPCKKGRYYMAYVKGHPQVAGTIFPRTHLVLAVTENGRDFQELMDIDRFDGACAQDVAELYQIIDPSLLVCEDYIYVTYGRSDDVGDGGQIHHHGQKIRCVRIKR